MSISIGKRILLGFVAITVVILALGLYALDQISAVRDNMNTIVKRDLTVARQLDDLGNKVRDMGLLRRNAVMAALMRNRPESELTQTLDSWRRIGQESEVLFGDIVRTANGYSATAPSPARSLAWKKLADTADLAANDFRQLRA
ncbi:MAG: methyl-accepting chemotaxis protein, partial [Methylobacterium sp.]